MKIKNTAIALIITISLCTGQLLAQKSNYSELLAQKANLIEPKVIAWRQDIHQYPELGNQEFRTAELVAKHLQALGIEVKTNVETEIF